MNDTASRLFVVVALILGVWVMTYWLYEPRSAPRVTQDAPLASPAPPRITIDPPLPAPEPTPAPAARVEAPPAGPPVVKVQPPEFREYIVQRGDTGWKQIAARPEVFGDASQWQLVARANPLASPDRLKPGVTVLKIPLDPENIQGKLVEVDPTGRVADVQPPAPVPDPAARTYTVTSDDSLWSIAKKMYGKGAAWKTIYDANRDVIKDPDRPVPGTILKIPASP